MVVTKRDGSLLADTQVEGRPSVNDLATLLAHAMRRPLTEGAHRPRRLHLRGHRQWQELFPHLEELGIKVSVQRELPKVQKAYQDYLRQMREAHRAGMVKPTAEQQSVEKLFPAIAKWVQGYGHIEIGDQERFGFVVRALDYGGLVFEDDKPDTLAEAMARSGEGAEEVVRGAGDRTGWIIRKARSATSRPQERDVRMKDLAKKTKDVPNLVKPLEPKVLERLLTNLASRKTDS